MNTYYEVESKEELIDIFESCIDGKNGLEVFVQMPDLPSFEQIYNPIENLPAKLEYYKKAYNDKLELNSFNKIKIVAIYVSI